MRWKETPDPWLLPDRADSDRAERRACREAQRSQSRRSSGRDGLLGDLLELGLDILFEVLD